jgi:hypothetical protein
MRRRFQKFLTAYLNPYLNFHRPCGYATIATNSRGNRKRTYRHKDYRTPYEKLTSLKGWTEYLKQGITAGMLKRQSEALSHTEAARRMQKAKLSLLARCRKTNEKPRRAGFAPRPSKTTEHQRKETCPGNLDLAIFRLTPHWNRTAVSGSWRIGINSRFQAHLWIGICWLAGNALSFERRFQIIHFESHVRHGLDNLGERRIRIEAHPLNAVRPGLVSRHVHLEARQIPFPGARRRGWNADVVE